MSVSTKDLRALATLMRADPECDGAAKMIEEAADEIDRMRSVIADLRTRCDCEMADESQCPSEMCCHMWERIEEAVNAIKRKESSNVDA